MTETERKVQMESESEAIPDPSPSPAIAEVERAPDTPPPALRERLRRAKLRPKRRRVSKLDFPLPTRSPRW